MCLSFPKKTLRYIITTTKTVYSLHFVSRQSQCSNISLLSYRDVSICYGSCSFQGIDAFSVNSRFSIKQPIYTVIRCQYPTPNVCVIVYACCLYHLFQRRLSVRQGNVNQSTTYWPLLFCLLFEWNAYKCIGRLICKLPYRHT